MFTVYRMKSSNRTFMELKSWIVGENVIGIRSSNRTFMELKYASMKPSVGVAKAVLIVPLWN